MTLCMLRPEEPEWYSAVTERRLRTSREIMTEVIRSQKDAPKALRSTGASCRRISMNYFGPEKDDD